MERILEFAGNHTLLITALVAMTVLVVFHEVRRKTSGAGQLGAVPAVRLINRGAAVVDVRDAEKFRSGHIVNAINVPLQSLQEDHKALAKYRKKPLLTVCDNGATSARAAAELRKAGFEQVYCLGGGLNAWRNENLPVVHDAEGGEGSKRSAAK